ncbi:hypothetical protein B0H21DRAFT_826446 [Amylocystis lapponica]|nr:hypothetical protein B0H21DRAFT_826446 [Amylocystis lapponica]
MPLTDDMAALIGFACESVLYGAYCILFLVSLTILVWRRGTSDIHIPLLVANVVLFLSCTAHFSLEFNHFYTTLQSTGVAGYANETHKLFGADILLSLSDFFGDIVLIYRCWLVWRKNYYIIILPFLTALAGFACIMELAHLLLTIDPTAPVAPAAIVPLGIAGYSLPLATNVIVTFLICGRIWLMARGDTDMAATLSSTSRATHHAIGIVIESGALYLVAQLVYLVLFTIEHPAQAIAGVIAAQIYGIAPTLIIIRVGLGMTSDTEVSKGPVVTPMSWYHSRRSALTTGAGTATTNSGWGMRNEIELGHRKTSHEKDDDASSTVPL